MVLIFNFKVDAISSFFWSYTYFKVSITLSFTFRFFIAGIDSYMTSANGVSPLIEPTAVPIALSIFHTTFNILNVAILIWFVPFIAKTVVKMVPSKGSSDEEYSLEYINSGIMATPEMSIVEAQKEIVKFGERTQRMNNMLKQLLTEQEIGRAHV